MKFHYILFLLFAVFITGLSDGISWALVPIPGVGFVLGIAIAFCINATMGVGLIFLLILNGMYHPRISPFGIIAGLIPGINVLPFWVALVIAGIIQKTKEEGGALGAIANVASGLQSAYQPGKNPLQTMREAVSVVQNVRGTQGRPETAQENSENEEPEQTQPSQKNRPMLADILPPKTNVQPA